MSMLGNGNVGIGATMPTSKLAIKGSGVGTGKAFSVLDSLDQEKFTILDNGSVGVGVTNPDALGALAIGGQTTTVVNISTTGTLGAGGRAILQMTNADGSAGYDFGVTSPVSPNFSIRDVAAVSIPRFTIDSVGNIGVSTTTPGARLSVRGGGTTTGQAFQITDSANTPKFTVLDNGAVTALNGITVNNARAQLNSGIGIAGGSDVGSSGSIWTNTSGPLFDTVLAGFNLSFYTGNNSSRVQRMILSTAGDLGLGTSTPAARLSIQSSFGSTTALFDVATTTSAAFATSSLFRINANGTIGVGTSTMANSVFTTLDGSASGKAIGLQLASSNSNTAQGQLRISSSPTSYTDFFQGTVSGNDSLNINVVGVTNNRLNLIFSNNATSYFDTNGWNIVNSGTALPQILLNRTSNYIQFRNGFNAPRVTLGTNGAVNGPGMLELYGVDDIKTVSINATSTSYLNTGANFGIGSTTPGARLSVKGSGTTTGQAFQITDSANAPKLTVLDNGNVGIGTTNPQAALSLSSGKAISVFNTADEVTNTESGRIEWVSNELRIGTSRAGTGSSRSLRLLALNDTSQIVMGNNPFVDFQQNANTTAAAGVFRFAQTGTNSMSAASGNQSFLNLQSRYNQTGTAAGTDLLIQRTEAAVGSGAQHLIQAGTSTNTSMFVVTNRGNIGLGTSTPTAQLSTTGTVRFAALTGAGSNLIVDALGNVTVSSDERLKDVSGQFTRGLADVRKLSPITYHWKAETGYDTASAYTGFSAQNVQSAIPEAVATSANGYLNLADRPIIAAVVNAVKELDLKISSLTDGTAELVVRRIKASELCLDDVCITKDQLRDLLNRNGVSASVSEPAAPAASQPVTESTPSAPVIETPVATTTPDVVATSTPEAIPEPVAVTEATSTTPVIEPTPEPVAPEPASEPVAPTEAPAPEL
jgi:cation transport regulator ChaC